ncbi:beta-N-acetylhexosaminidase [Vibrio sp. VB16]|uniref:beta-N-acetylhexosaminidase n=1 Tax=Vibrio sp. VB16 TaxID=2785746 RepID=UPI00189CD608|nr:beta-N-acetylhexosaminidase [Vibrio sp. VB16]UGA55258.1 beta-N-acetylhexosaminidase [Vibrio sp. VB16]
MTYKLDTTVLTERDNQSTLALTLHNVDNHSVNNWTLHFTFDRYIQPKSVSNGHIKQIGSYCVFTPDNGEMLAKNGPYSLEFTIETPPLRFYSDGLFDAFLQQNSPHSDKIANVKQRFAVDVSNLSLICAHIKKTEVAQVNVAELSLIPIPTQLTRLDDTFTFHSLAIASTELSFDAVTWFNQELLSRTGIKAELSSLASANILLKTNKYLEDEAYHLTISPNKITIESSTHNGFIYAEASLLQLLQQSNGLNTLPCLEISDKPNYRYRGMMLDCARHLHSIDKIKQIINQLAYYKFNTFHWHLTDDEGWRIEIDAFPELTQVGAWRGPDKTIHPQFSFASECYGGFYTKEQIRDVVEYANRRGINVIPEIDIPGHCRAAILSLPHLLIEDEDKSEYRSIQHYTDNVLNPGIQGTYNFIDTVIDEICELFPSKYIHIGADEVPSGVWENSPACQRLLNQEGYTEYPQLQGHLLRHVEKRLQNIGRRMLGWEEAQHGNKVSNETVIYAWQNEAAAIKCATQGFDVVLQPGQYTYLDMAQDFNPEESGVHWANVLPLEKVYCYQPLADLAKNAPIREKVLGIQCALWCELIPTEKQLDYMLYPRLLAVAETAWSQTNNRIWKGFLSRLKGHLPILQQQGIHFRDPWKESLHK